MMHHDKERKRAARRTMAKWRGSAITVLVIFLAVWAWARWWPMAPLFQAPCSTVITDRDGGLLGAVVAADGQWRFPAADSVPHRFATCLIAFEDRRFHEHHGVRLPSLVRAWMQNRRAGRVVSGGSTLTMQVARLHYGPGPRTMKRKVREMLLALRMEQYMRKGEILSLFAANAPFGGNVVGLEAAAWRWFGKPPGDLGWAESATLAVLPNAPSQIYPGKGQEALRRKRDRLLTYLFALGKLDRTEWSLALEEPLPGAPLPMPMRAPHLLHTLAARGMEGRSAHTTIDAQVQDAAMRAMTRHAQQLAANEVHNGAALVMDIVSGEVLAYVGNMPGASATHAGMVDVVQAPRSTGSLLKPFLHAAMLEAGELMPDMLVVDIPTRYEGFAPRNYDAQHAGAVPASQALSRSLNVPAVRLLRDHGVDRALRSMRGMGLEHLRRDAAHYGLALVVGGAESTLWQLAGAYASMARMLQAQGPAATAAVLPPTLLPRTATEAAGREAPIGPAAAYLTLTALQQTKRPETEAAWHRFPGQGRVAWKTGTSPGHRDGWAIGMDGLHCVAVWTGNASGEGRPGLTGTLAAAPIMFDIFGTLPEGPGFHTPHDHLVTATVCSASGYRANQDCGSTAERPVPEAALRTPVCPYHQRIALGDGSTRSWFVLPPAVERHYMLQHPMYEPLPAAMQHASGPAMEVVIPEHGSLITLPTLLDGSRGDLVMEAAHRDPAATLHWHLDGAFIGSTRRDHRMPVSPEPGAHRLTLTAPDGTSVHVLFSIDGRGSDR